VGEFNRRFQVPAAQPGTAFVACPRKDLDPVFSLQFERAVNKDNTVSFQNLSLQIEPVSWRGTLAGCTVTMHRHLDGQPHPDARPAQAGVLHGARLAVDIEPSAAGQGRGKDAAWKSQKNYFPTPLGNPAKCAGFPLSNRLFDYEMNFQTGHFTCLENRPSALAKNIEQRNTLPGMAITPCNRSEKCAINL